MGNFWGLPVNSAAPSHRPGKPTERPAGMRQLNDSVWELYNPSRKDPLGKDPSEKDPSGKDPLGKDPSGKDPSGKDPSGKDPSGKDPSKVPQVDVIFFHGLQFSDYGEAFWKTWLSRDETVVWPKDWLPERLPKARILSVSYESSARQSRGEMDLYTITENLISDLILTECGAGQHSPVVLVGHSLGGIIIKNLLLECDKLRGEMSQRKENRIQIFLENCKGVFYYATPHGGSFLADYAAVIPGKNDPIVNLLKTLSTETARINNSFARSRHKKGIVTQALAESHPTTFKWLHCIVVPEASARQDVDRYYTAPADHINVCRPKDKTGCSSFMNLLHFIDSVVRKGTTTQAFPRSN